MSNNKQSSVEWVIGEIIRHQMTFYGTSSMPLWIIEQAKAMHKEEIERAFNEGENNSVDYFNPENKIKECEQYYNETFNSKEK